MMDKYFLEKNDIVESVILDCSPAEWLVINKALRLLVDNPDENEEDRAIAKDLINTETEFIES